MPSRDDELKARLEAQASAVIAELLPNQKGHAAMTLADIEAAVRKAGQAFEQALTSELVQETARQVEQTWPTCPQCGERLKAKGKRERRVVTETGEVKVAREYYHCATCQVGLFPPGPTVGIGAEYL